MSTRHSTLDLTQAKHVGVPRITHPIQGRTDIATQHDFLVFTEHYVKPEYGVTDQYGTLIDESSSKEDAGVTLITRTYIDTVPQPHSECVITQLQHDTFNTASPTYRYARYWRPRANEEDDPQPPADSALPEGASLYFTCDIFVKKTVYEVYALNEDGEQEKINEQEVILTLGGIWYIYIYEVDSVTFENLAEARRLASTNFQLEDRPSSAVIPTTTKIHSSYFVLPNGPTSAEYLPATPLGNQYGGSISSIVRSANTIIEAATFTRVVGALWVRQYSTWVGVP